MDNNLPSSGSALRRLLWLLAIIAAIVLYAYGWNTTEISLEEVQDETRQESVQRAMRELLSPDIFDRDREQESTFVEFTIGCPTDAELEGRAASEGDAYVIFTPPCADTDDVINIEGFNFPASAISRIQLYREGRESLPFKLAKVSGDETDVSDEAIFDIDSSGYFNVDVKVPRGRGLSGATHQIEIQSAVPTGWPRFSQTTETVVEKMIETIFLALMATSLALPISVVLSFVAARNLMRQIELPLGNVLFGVVMLPIGGMAGVYLLGPLGQLGVDWGRDLYGLAIAAAAIAGFGFLSGYANQLELEHAEARVRSIVLNALLLAVMILTLGVLGGIGIWLGEQLEGDIIDYLGNFVDTLGTLVDLTITGLAAVMGAFWLASFGSTLVAGPLRNVHAPLSNSLGAILGMISGALLLAATAYIGTQAVLLGIITPIVAAVLAGQILIQLYQILTGTQDQQIKSDADRAVRLVLFAVGSVAAFVGTAIVIDLIRAVVDGRPPSSLTWDLGLFEVRQYIAKAALVGAVLGGIGGGLAGTQRAFPLGMAIYNTSRTILNTLRSIEPLIMGIVFVIWVGVGPFAGVLALTLHSIAALGKLYSEQVENIDPGPIEAIQSTGANRLQTIIYGVVPQIVPPYIAFTMYRWDINVRMSTIIGFVGGGGIGFLLQQQINLLRYRQAGVAVLAIAIVVSVLDYASAAIRERIV